MEKKKYSSQLWAAMLEWLTLASLSSVSSSAGNNNWPCMAHWAMHMVSHAAFPFALMPFIVACWAEAIRARHWCLYASNTLALIVKQASISQIHILMRTAKRGYHSMGPNNIISFKTNSSYGVCQEISRSLMYVVLRLLCVCLLLISAQIRLCYHYRSLFLVFPPHRYLFRWVAMSYWSFAAPRDTFVLHLHISHHLE